MKKLVHSSLLGLAILAGTGAFADSLGFHSPDSEACYQQTLALQRGEDPARLEAGICNRALATGPGSNAHRSAMLHNRAMIEIAQGRVGAALASLEEAVRLAPEIGPQHVALAQLAARTGHSHRAAELYRLLAESKSKDPLIAENRELFRRNGDLLVPESIAGTAR